MLNICYISMLYKYMLTDGFICACLRCRWGTDSARCRPKVFGVWTLVGPWNHFWWGPGPSRGRCNFLEGPVNTTTSKHDVGPTPRRIGPTSAGCRADEQTTSIRCRADVNYRYVADVVLTSARRRRVYGEIAAAEDYLQKNILAS